MYFWRLEETSGSTVISMIFFVELGKFDSLTQSVTFCIYLVRETFIFLWGGGEGGAGKVRES